MRLGARIIGTFNLHPSPFKRTFEWRMIWFSRCGVASRNSAPAKSPSAQLHFDTHASHKGVLALAGRHLIWCANFMPLCYLFLHTLQAKPYQRACTLQTLQLKCIAAGATSKQRACIFVYSLCIAAALHMFWKRRRFIPRLLFIWLIAAAAAMAVSS